MPTAKPDVGTASSCMRLRPIQPREGRGWQHLVASQLLGLTVWVGLGRLSCQQRVRHVVYGPKLSPSLDECAWKAVGELVELTYKHSVFRDIVLQYIVVFILYFYCHLYRS